MTDSEKELVKLTLDALSNGSIHLHTYVRRMATALEAAERERDEARAECDDIKQRQFPDRIEKVTKPLIARAEAAEAEVASLSMQLDGARGCLKETETEVARLREALTKIAHRDTFYGTMPEIARAALEAKHD